MEREEDDAILIVWTPREGRRRDRTSPYVGVAIWVLEMRVQLPAYLPRSDRRPAASWRGGGAILVSIMVELVELASWWSWVGASSGLRAV